MNFRRYIENPLALYFYKKYFFFKMRNEATEEMALYEGEELLGLLFLHREGENQKFGSFGSEIFVSLMDWFQRTFFREEIGSYGRANEKMLESLKGRTTLYGEVLLLVANPKKRRSGIGSALLRELEKKYPGEFFYLFTDDGCDYPFYEKKGFSLEGKEQIEMELEGKKVPVMCLMYGKEM